MGKLKAMAPRLRPFDGRRIKAEPKRADPIYADARYRAFRNVVIARAAGHCQDTECKTPQRRPSRLFADHIIEVQDLLRDGGDPFDPANGLARCGSCHTRKTARVRAKRLSAPPA